MKLEKSRDTLQSAALSRARMFLKADLGWLSGFPLGDKERSLEWIVVSREDGHAVERATLSRENLQKAVYTYNRLVRHFPRALPRAVENIRAWKRGVPLLLDMLKPCLQTNTPFPQSILALEGVFPPGAIKTGLELGSRFPFLGRFVDALGYILFLTPEELSPALKWTSLWASEIRNFQDAHPGDEGLLSLVALWELSRRQGYKDTNFLIQIIGDKRASALPTHGWAFHLNGLQKAIVESTWSFFRAKLPSVPRPELIDKILEFVTWGLRQSRETSRRALELSRIVLDFDFLTPWEAAWRRLEETPSARRHIQKGLSTASLQQEIQRVESRIKSLLRDRPPEIHITTLLSDIRTFSSPSRAADFPALCRALRALPAIHDGTPARAAFLHDWADPDKISNPLLAHALRRFAGYASPKRGSGTWLKPWENVLIRWTEGPGWVCSVMEVILSGHKEPAVVELAFQILAKASAARPEGLGYGEACRLVALVKALKDGGLALKYAKSMTAARTADSHPEEKLILAAHFLATGEEEFGRMFESLCKMDASAVELESVLQLDRELRAKGWEGVVKEAVLSGDGQSVVDLAARRKALISLGGACDPPERGRAEDAPGWIDEYPAEFAGSLAALTSLWPKAEQTARRVFGQDYIPPAALREEVEILEAKVRSSPESRALAKRLDNLRSRLEITAGVAPGKFLRMKKRLDRAVRREVFRWWNRRLDEEFLSALRQTLGVASFPAALIVPSFWPVLTSLMGLPKPFREIGLELLRRRCGPSPWDLHDHPSNRAFLEKIREKGIDPEPWVQEGAAQTVEAENGRRLRVAFEEDPLEIFRMGAYFQTCLSPGGVNFYSTVSNAADINKRVLFARDEAGKIAGRCLLALSDQGGILTFHPYAHDKSLGFPLIVSRFAADLASRMKTAVVARGRVERLVAPRWYDDGPRDTSLCFSYLEEKTDFRSRLEAMKPEVFLETVIETVKPLALNSLTLPPIVMLPELEDKPELIVPLLAPLARCEDVPIEVWARAADLARQAGRLDQARGIFRLRIVPYISRQIKSDNLNKEIIMLGLEFDPSAVLRIFRQTRPRRVKTDEQEPSYRRKFIAKAHEALGRKKLAGRLRPESE